MLKNVNRLILSICLVIVSACTTNDLEPTLANRITMVTSGDVSLVSKTYAWHQTMFSVHTKNTQDEEPLRELLRQSVNKVMAAKGYQQVAYTDSPQMLIGFGMALESEMSDTEILAKAGLVPGLSTHGVDKKLEKGSVLIAFFNPLVKEPYWRVLAQGFTEHNKSVDKRAAGFDALSKMMLSAIPSS
ncbi:DUF4136 domain-containing protein [Shewanella subflava]|jgi:hypothetical protein|uniref:DUF4136 domain-containing protein n=1 Tax=Shewanella subflava TaxID=2986476 RepID=A0ABT3IDR9_9GAMM|nr:DUF4136 domain-containing protein [Shewanella subflava]MCW3174110.1 DUF4136 domain-containing protein [Shewanella subflava]